MRVSFFRGWIGTGAMVAFMGGGAVALGQARPAAEGKASSQAIVEVRSIEGIGNKGLIRTPEYRTSVSSGRIPPREWARLVVTYDSAPEWSDELAFQFYVMLESKKKEYTLLKGAVTYADVQKGRRHQSEMFIRPTTLLRYGEVKGVAVEVLHKGETVAVESDPPASRDGKKPEWWKDPERTPRDGYLLKRSDTPFAFINYDDYEVEK